MASKCLMLFVVFYMLSAFPLISSNTLSLSPSFQERMNERQVEMFIIRERAEKGLQTLSHSNTLHELANNFAKTASNGVTLTLDEIREEVRRAGYTKLVHSIFAWGTAQDVKAEWSHTNHLLQVILLPNNQEFAVAQEANTWIALFGEQETYGRDPSKMVALGANAPASPAKPTGKPGKTNTDDSGDDSKDEDDSIDEDKNSNSTKSTKKPNPTTLSNVEKIALGMELLMAFLIVVWLVAATVLGGLSPERVSCLHR